MMSWHNMAVHIMVTSQEAVPVSPPSPTIRAPIYECYFTYIVLQALVVLAPDSIDQAEMSGEWRICQKSELTTYHAYYFV